MSTYEDALDIEGVTYDLLASGDTGGGYDWSEGAVLRDADGQLYYVEDSGCSCSYFGEYLTRSDLVAVPSWQAAVEEAKKGFALDENEVARLAEKLSAIFRPVAA